MALDWFTVLSLVPVSAAVWADLARSADVRAVESIPCRCGATDGVLPLEVRRLGRDLVARSVAGVRLLIREPSRLPVRRVEVCGWRSADMTADRTVRGGWGGVRCLGSVVTPGEGLEGLERRAAVSPSRCERAPAARCRFVGGELGLDLRRVGGEERREVYGVEVQIQGAAFSTCDTGGDGLVWDVWESLCLWLYGDRGWGESPATVVDRFTRAGRMDVACDVAFHGDDGAAWVSSGIFAHGSHPEAFARWSTRARKVRSEETIIARPEADGIGLEGVHREEGTGDWVPLSGRRSLLGKETAGRTAYLGSSEYVLLCVYERSKKRDGDWSVLEPTLRRCGWDGSAEVIRSEFRVSRRWLADQVLRNGDGSAVFPREAENLGPGEIDARRCAELSVLEALRALPALVGEFPSRFRHTDPSQDVDGPRLRDRRSSSWWLEVERGARGWRVGWGDVGRVVSTRRLAAAERTVGAIRSALIRLVALRGALGLSDVWAEVSDAYHRDAEERDDTLKRIRGRYGIAPPVRVSRPQAVPVQAEAVA